MPPVASGEVQHLTGNNITYTNETLRAIRDRRPDLLRDGFFEAFVNAELRSSGNRLYLHSPAVVSMQSGSSFGKAVRHSYHGGRVYGARRPVKGMRRLIYGADQFSASDPSGESLAPGPPGGEIGANYCLSLHR
jgi:hypothetical protein